MEWTGRDRLIRIEDPSDPRIAEFTAMRDKDLAGRGNLFIAEGKVVLQPDCLSQEVLDAIAHAHDQESGRN